MDELLHGIKDMFVRVYMDDFVLASKRTDCTKGESIEDLHYKQLKALLIRFSKGGMSLKAKKTDLLKTRIVYVLIERYNHNDRHKWYKKTRQ